MNIILFNETEINHNEILLNDLRALHIIKILKCKIGDSIKIGVINGLKGLAKIEKIYENDSVILKIIDLNIIDEIPKIELILAMPRPKVLKRLWAQISALGVSKIHLTNAWKVEKNYFDSHVISEDFYKPLLIEGLQQSGNTQLPEVFIYKRFTSLLNYLGKPSTSIKVLADPNSDIHIKELFLMNAKSIFLAIGPEGGWISEELSKLQELNFQLVKLNSRILRTDTAVISLLSIISNLN